MREILPLLLCGVFVFFMVLIVINFTIESYQADQRYKEAIRKIQEGTK
jgi:hypothetical protein